MSDVTRQLAAWLEYAAELGIESMAVRLPQPAAPAKAAPSPPRRAAARPAAAADGGALDRMRASLGDESDAGRPAPRPGERAAKAAGLPSLGGTRGVPARAVSRVAGGTLERMGEVPADRLAIAGEAEQAPAAPADLDAIRATIGDCTRCRLHQGRTRLVFGVGNPEAELMFVGEGPGADEDRQGEPFVGRAGKLLNDIIKAIGMRREDVYIANVVKCRPPDNRTPEADEAATCRAFLYRQLAVIRPKIVVALGRPASEALLERSVAISRERGQVFDLFGARLVPTFHPAYLLRNEAKKREVWEDMKLVRDMLVGARGADGSAL